MNGNLIVVAPVLFGTATVVVTSDRTLLLVDGEDRAREIPRQAGINLIMADYPLPDGKGNPASRSVSGCIEVAK